MIVILQLGLDGDASGGLEADVDLEAELAALMCSPSDQPPTRAAQKAKKGPWHYLLSFF